MARTNVRWVRVGVLAVGLALSGSVVRGTVGAGATQPVASRTYVVRPGDTLWLVASRLVGPHGDPRPTVDRLIALNAVRGGVILPGQRLSLP